MPPLKDRWPAPEEHQLILRVRDGDPSALEALFHSYFAAAVRFAMTFVASPDTAEDLVQDVFAWIWVHRGEWAPAGDILSYLLTAVRHRALDVWRTEKRRTEAKERYIVPGESPAMAAALVSTETKLEDDERNAAIWRVVLELPEQRRTVLLLRWRHGLEWEEIAKIMETSVAAARMNHSRALHALRKALPEGVL